MQNPRYIVFKALSKVEVDGAYSNITLDAFLKDSDITQRDVAFVTALFYGVLEKRISLDYIISRFSSMPLRKIEKSTLTILRMGVFQIVFMDKVPDSAAVNEAVRLCKKARMFSSSGFVNGVLRSISRAENKLPLPDRSDAVKFLSVKFSCPEDIISLWIKDYSRVCAEGILSQLSGRPPIFARVNTLKTTREQLMATLESEGVKVKAVEALENAVEICCTNAVYNLESYKSGLFHIQDLSSQICCEMLSPKSGEVVADVCSAPGGKAFTLAEMLHGSGAVNCYDIHRHKLELIRSGTERLGIDTINIKCRDALGSTPLEISDKILCDVPCSGLGVLRRKPEIRYKADTGVDTLPEIQYNILVNSAKYLKSGGILVYSTCTLHKAENNDVADRFLAENSGFEPYPLNLPEGIKRTVDEPTNQLTLFPHTNNTDGFFISAFLKR